MFYELVNNQLQSQLYIIVLDFLYIVGLESLSSLHSLKTI